MIWQERIFSEDECKKIIEYANVYTMIDDKFNPDGKFVKNGDITIDGNRLSHRTSFSYNFYNIPNNDDTQWMFDKLINWFEYKSGVRINRNGKMMDTGLHHYTKGDKFKKHIDLSPLHPDRRYNLGIQLNNEYEGGEYVCWDNMGNEIIISKEVGNALAYHCKIEHEIKEISQGDRWSIVLPLPKQAIIENKNLL
jgi:hypothetical protein